MADSISVTSGLLALVAFALQSSEVLNRTIASLRSTQKVVLEIREELKVLDGVLKKLQEMAGNPDVDLALLQAPLLGYGKACKGAEEVISKIAARFDGSRTNVRDWAGLKYVGEDIIRFRKLLAGYRSSFTIALADANIRASAPTSKVLDECEDMITNTTVNLEKRLQEIDKKLQALPQRDPTLSDEIALERQQIQEERDSTQQCLSICAGASTQIHDARNHTYDDISVAEGGHSRVLVSAIGDLLSLSAKSVTAGNGSRSLLGQISDASLEPFVSLHAKDDAIIRRLSDQSPGELISVENVVAGDRSVSLIGQTSDGPLEHILPSHARDDASINGWSDQSSISSVGSSVASLFSGRSGSSKSSVLGPAGAGERLVALLLNDNQLSLLYREALERVTATKFERKFRQMLKKFAIELRKEAKDSQQRGIASFVRYRARNCAHLVRNSVCSPDKPREDTTPTSTVIHEPLNLESDESDEDSGPDHEDNNDLQKLEEFIITSQALIELRKVLTSFVYPINDEKTHGKGKRAVVNNLNDKGELEKQELCKQKPSINAGNLHITSSALSVEPEVVPSTGMTSDKKLDNCKPFNERSSQWHISGLMTRIREFWEPQVHEGKVRIRWKCKCGQNLYDDYIELQSGAAKRLEESLNQRQGGGETLPTRHRPTHLATMGSLFMNVFTKLCRTLSIQEHGLPLQNVSPTTSVQHLAAPQSSLGEALFVLICHSVSTYDKKLLQLSVGDITSDETFFRALKKHFQSKRTRWLSFFSIRTLIGIRFVKFELYRKSQSVDICLKDDIPSPHNPDYHYTPVPLDVVPPVSENMLMHFLDNPECAEDVRACLDRFPKKLREKLACGDKAITPGWGLDLEEGVCKRKTVIVYMICVLVSSIWGILWTVLRHDIQGAFSISAYMIGITVPLVTLMQHLA